MAAVRAAIASGLPEWMRGIESHSYGWIIAL